jgi:hypothetical protein
MAAFMKNVSLFLQMILQSQDDIEHWIYFMWVKSPMLQIHFHNNEHQKI